MAALRPASLPLVVGPVVVGSAAAWAHDGHWPVGLALMALAAALLMQLLTNLQNDVGYTVRGGEQAGGRSGLPRATAEGWLTVRAVRRAIVVLAVGATALGLALVVLRGWPVLLIGSASLLAALAYMGGPRPIAYTPFGELTVLVFFGLVAVPGTEWLLSGRAGAAGLLGGLAVGACAAAALAVNNHRDAAHDRAAGRRTLAVVAGPRGSAALLGGLLAVPWLACALGAWLAQQPAWALPLLLAPRAVVLWRRFRAARDGPALTGVLLGVFRLQLPLAGLLALGLVLGRQAGGAG